MNLFVTGSSPVAFTINRKRGAIGSIRNLYGVLPLPRFDLRVVFETVTSLGLKSLFHFVLPLLLGF